MISAGQKNATGVIMGGGSGMIRVHEQLHKAIPPEPSWRSARRGDLPRKDLGMTDVTPTLPRAIPPGHSLCYVVGWPSLGAIKIGNAATMQRVKRWTSMRDGQLLRLDIFDHWTGGCLREVALSVRVDAMWPRRWERKDQAAGYLGCRTAGWTEFYAVPCDEWRDFMAALEVSA